MCGISVPARFSLSGADINENPSISTRNDIYIFYTTIPTYLVIPGPKDYFFRTF